MNTIRIFKVTESDTEIIGEFTHDEYKKFYSHAELFMQNMSDVYPHLTLLHGVWSVHLWDESKHKAVLSYTAEIISNE